MRPSLPRSALRFPSLPHPVESDCSIAHCRNAFLELSHHGCCAAALACLRPPLRCRARATAAPLCAAQHHNAWGQPLPTNRPSASLLATAYRVHQLGTSGRLIVHRPPAPRGCRCRAPLPHHSDNHMETRPYPRCPIRVLSTCSRLLPPCPDVALSAHTCVRCSIAACLGACTFAAPSAASPLGPHALRL
jgi:hypothetical protein